MDMAVASLDLEGDTSNGLLSYRISRAWSKKVRLELMPGLSKMGTQGIIAFTSTGSHKGAILTTPSVTPLTANFVHVHGYSGNVKLRPN